MTSRYLRCPECGAPCWRNEIDVGVGIVSDEWKCTVCSWDEDQAFPMSAANWEDFLRADDIGCEPVQNTTDSALPNRAPQD